MSQSFTREAACRLLRVSAKQLTSWERQKLIQPAPLYGVRELLALRTLIKLRQSRVAPQQIRRAVQALLKKLSNIEDPLIELKLYADGKKIRVEVEGRRMDAMSGQLLLDFDAVDLRRLLEFRSKPNRQTEREQRLAAEHWFQHGLDLEASGAAALEIIDAYRKAIEIDPSSAGALVNLGTIYFNLRNFAQAERYYKQATETDPDYALAHFDLANLHDERGDRARALEHYLAALRIAPNYADAHYNVALLYQGTQESLKAVRHWMAYLKLDPSSEWALIARRELSKLREAAVVRGR